MAKILSVFALMLFPILVLSQDGKQNASIIIEQIINEQSNEEAQKKFEEILSDTSQFILLENEFNALASTPLCLPTKAFCSLIVNAKMVMEVRGISMWLSGMTAKIGAMHLIWGQKQTDQESIFALLFLRMESIFSTQRTGTYTG